jgi:hypothetical protein
MIDVPPLLCLGCGASFKDNADSAAHVRAGVCSREHGEPRITDDQVEIAVFDDIHSGGMMTRAYVGDGNIETDRVDGGFVGVGYTKGVPTSKAAAEFVVKKLNERQRRVLAVVAAYGTRGMTTLEVANEMGVPRDTISPRFKELETGKYIQRKKILVNGELVTKTRTAGGSAKPCVVWVVNYMGGSNGP